MGEGRKGREGQEGLVAGGVWWHRGGRQRGQVDITAVVEKTKDLSYPMYLLNSQPSNYMYVLAT